jgi:hypothetical protein
MMSLAAHAQAVQEAPSAARAAFRTLLVHVQPDADSEPRLKAAVALARQFDATLLGLGAEMIPPAAATDPTGLLGGGFVAAMQEAIEGNLERAGAVFRRETIGLRTDWLAFEAIPTEAIARLSRGADLIIAGGAPLKDTDHYRSCPSDETMLLSGRPVLIVPPLGGTSEFSAVVVAWKDTRESRRALADSLPFLKDAEQVLILAVCNADEVNDAWTQTAGVVNGLKRHGVEAAAKVADRRPGDQRPTDRRWRLRPQPAGRTGVWRGHPRSAARSRALHPAQPLTNI